MHVCWMEYLTAFEGIELLQARGWEFKPDIALGKAVLGLVLELETQREICLEACMFHGRLRTTELEP